MRAIPVGSRSPRIGLSLEASTDTPRKHEPRITAIHISVCAAFRDSGFLNAGTPLLTASTPDSATAPEEKARSSIKSDSEPASFDSATASALVVAGLIGPRPPMKIRQKPTTI